MHRIPVTTLLIGLLLALGSCTPLTRPDSALRVGEVQEPDSLNPLLANLGISNDVFNLIFNGLVRFDDHGNAVPDLAQELPTRANAGISRDGLTVTYRLRRNVRWHDGARFTSRDVLFTWLAIMNPANNVPSRAGYDQIRSIQTPDDYTVRFLLKRRYAPFLSLFRCAKQGAIVPAHLLEHQVSINTADFNGQPIGTGPYKLVRWVRGDRMEFERSPYARAKLPRIVWHFFPDGNSLINALQSGDIDIALALSPQQLRPIGNIARIRIKSVPTSHWEHLTFNLRAGSGPQTNIHIRRAIAYAIDPRRILQTVYLNTGALAPLDQAPTSWAHDASVHYYPHDLNAARREIAAAGFSKQHPPSLTIISTSGDQTRADLEVYLQSCLKAVGIDLAIKNIPASMLLTRPPTGALLSGNFELAYYAFTPPFPDPDDRNYVATDTIPPNGLNVSAYRNADVTRWSRAAAQIYEIRLRRLQYHRIQERLISDLPFYTLNWLAESDAFDRRLHGVRPVANGSDFWNVSTWDWK